MSAAVLTLSPDYPSYGSLRPGEVVEFCDDLPQHDGVQHDSSHSWVWLRAASEPARISTARWDEVLVTAVSA